MSDGGCDLAISLRHHDLFVHPLDRPAVIDKIGGQPVEQLRDASAFRLSPQSCLGCRRWPCRSDIARSGSRSIERSSGFCSIGNPLGQCEPPTVQLTANDIRDHRRCRSPECSSALMTHRADFFAGGFQRSTGVDVADEFGIASSNLVRHPHFAAFRNFGVGPVVDALHHRLVSFQSSIPNPLILLANLQSSLFDVIEANMTRRFIFVGKILALGLAERILGHVS